MGKKKKGDLNAPQKKYGKYDEPKLRTNMTLTNHAIMTLDEVAERQGLNRSELVEQWARSLVLNVTPQEAYLLGE
jgi:hypothetical protein